MSPPGPGAQGAGRVLGRGRGRGCPAAEAAPSTEEALQELFEGLPPISRDGGGSEEFEEHWEYWRRPRELSGGWLERRVHPQVAPSEPCPYWYHMESRTYAFERPVPRGDREDVCDIGEGPPLQDDGPVWAMSCDELKQALKTPGEQERLGLTPDGLAARAVHEYESWLPRVQSWHDYQYHTFWFLGHDVSKGFTREAFASDAFYRAVARLATRRLRWIHPVSIAYLTWTFSRPMVVVPEFLEAVGNFLTDGFIPMMDRCALCTLLWCYWKMQTPHRRFFDAAALEIKRPVRLRSLAPRNFQNSMIAFSRMRYDDPELLDRLALGIRRLLDRHDPRGPKTDTSVLFSYTCLNGHEVGADAFRIGGLTVVLRAFEHARASGPALEQCYASMADYTLRSMSRSPPMMRDANDAAEFVTALAQAAARQKALKELLDPFIQVLPDVICGSSWQAQYTLSEAFYAAGLDITIL